MYKRQSLIYIGQNVSVNIKGGTFIGGGFKNAVKLDAYTEEDFKEIGDEIEAEMNEFKEKCRNPLFIYIKNSLFTISNGIFYGDKNIIGCVSDMKPDNYNNDKSYPDAVNITGGQWQVGDLDAYLTDGQTKTERCV